MHLCLHAELSIQETQYQNKNSSTLKSSLLQAENGIKSLSTILTKHLTHLGQIWPKYLPFIGKGKSCTLI